MFYRLGALSSRAPRAVEDARLTSSRRPPPRPYREITIHSVSSARRTRKPNRASPGAAALGDVAHAGEALLGAMRADSNIWSRRRCHSPTQPSPRFDRCITANTSRLTRRSSALVRGVRPRTPARAPNCRCISPSSSQWSSAHPHYAADGSISRGFLRAISRASCLLYAAIDQHDGPLSRTMISGSRWMMAR